MRVPVPLTSLPEHRHAQSRLERGRTPRAARSRPAYSGPIWTETAIKLHLRSTQSLASSSGAGRTIGAMVARLLTVDIWFFASFPHSGHAWTGPNSVASTL